MAVHTDPTATATDAVVAAEAATRFAELMDGYLGTQLLYSYKLNPQTVFFAGYSDNRLEDGTTGLLEPTGRTVFLKLSYAWTP